MRYQLFEQICNHLGEELARFSFTTLSGSYYDDNAEYYARIEYAGIVAQDHNGFAGYINLDQNNQIMVTMVKLEKLAINSYQLVAPLQDPRSLGLIIEHIKQWGEQARQAGYLERSVVNHV